MDGAEIPVAAKGWRKADHLGRGTLFEQMLREAIKNKNGFFFGQADPPAPPFRSAKKKLKRYI